MRIPRTRPISREIGRTPGLLEALLLACLVACASPGPESGGSADPLFWRARAGESGVLYLLGSVHLGTPEMLVMPPAVTQAWAQSEELVVEVDLSQISPQAQLATTSQYGLLPSGENLADVVSPKTYAELEAHLQQQGVPVEVVSTFKPWTVSLMLGLMKLKQAGLDPELGVDQTLVARAAGEKSIQSLETFDSQLRMMDELPPAVQEQLLRDELAPKTEQDPAAFAALWQRGDEAGLMELVFAEQGETYDILYERVYYARNEAMAQRLAELAQDGRTRFVVVGVGHMVGPRGIPALLRELGFGVEQLGGRGARSLVPPGPAR